MNENELYHSEIYLGKDFSDGIRHWKYVKRVKKNGKWVYYYDDAEYTNAKSNANLASKNLEKAKTAEKTAMDKYWNAKANIKRAEDYNPLDGTAGSKERRAIAVEVATGRAKFAEYKYNKAISNTKTASEHAKKAVEQYRSVALKTAPRRIIAQGIAAIGNVLSTLSSKINSYIKKK